MSTKIKFLLFFVFISFCANAQVKIGQNPNTINSASIVELESTDKALVLTRLTTAQMQAINPLNGAVVYNTDTQCVHYYNGLIWTNLCDGNSSSSFSFTDNGDGTITLSDGNGNNVTFNGAAQTISTLADNGDGTYTYTNENGIETVISIVSTDNQNLQTDNTPGNISIDNGNAIAINVDDADADDQNEIQTLNYTSGVLTLSNDPNATTVDLSGFDQNAADDFDGEWTSLANRPAGLDDGDDDTQLSEAEVDAFVANNNYSTGAHTTDAADLTTGVLADARVQESNVTQHQTALTITESQISDLVHTVDTDTQLSEAEVDAFVANNNYSTGAHTTDAADLTTGVLDDARVQESNVTQHQTALTITESQISDLVHTVDTDTQLSEAEVDAFVANNNYSTGAHTTDAADLTTGVLDDARVQESNVTQHQTALTITESQISDLVHTVDTDTQLSEAEVDAFVANNNYSTGAHTTDAADLTTGVLDDARVQESNVTQHQTALTITESQISDLVHTVDTDTQLSEAEVDAFVANNNYSTGAHTTDAADLTTGVLDDARVQESNVTQHQTALTITESQISDLVHTVDTDTQYTAGTGLTLNTTTFSVNNLAGDVTGPTNATVIADGAISGGAGGKIVDNSITASDLAPNSVNASEINSNAVGTSELKVDAVETENILNGNVTPIKIQPGSNNQVLTTNSSGTVVWENQSPDISTNLTQNTTTGLITYTNETNASQTANTVGAETNNNISVGANGGAFYASPIKAIGKISSTGTITKATAGVTVTRISVGYYRVTLPAGSVSDADYIIQLSQPGRNGVGNDDPGISYSNQTATSFEVIIGDNDNGGTDRSRFDSEFMFTVLDL